MASVGSTSAEDCKCPVCFDIFQDPVVLQCGHSFCGNCIRECWRQTAQRACPACRTVSTTAQPPRNLALRNLCDTLRTARSQNDSPEMCSIHREKLKLFCEEDQQLICVICWHSKNHKTHNCVPVNEAAEAQRTQLKVQLMSLKSKLGQFKSEKTKLDGMASHMKLQAGKTEKTIKDEFQKLYRFLRAEETARIDALKKEEAEKSKLMKDNIAKLESDISALTQKVTNLEKEMRATDAPFMQKVNDTIKMSQCDLTVPEAPRDALIDEAKHVSNLLWGVWKKMENLTEYVPVTLNPNTGCKWLMISELMTRASVYYRPLPDNPERLDGVLGYQGFKSGKHFWDVKVEGFWALGVAEKSGSNSYDFWGIYNCACTNWIHELTPTDGRNGGEVLDKDSFPTRIRVLLDYNRGTLSFTDLDKTITLHTIKETFSGTVLPYFGVNENGSIQTITIKALQ